MQKCKYFFNTCKRHITMIYGSFLITLIIYSYLHYRKGDLNLFLPFFLLSIVGITIAYIRFILFKDITSFPIKITLASGIIATYPVFLFGGFTELSSAWILVLVPSLYLLLPTKEANIFVLIYIILLFIPVVLHFIEIIKLPYPWEHYIHLFSLITFLIVIGNSIIKDFHEGYRVLEQYAELDTLTGIYNKKTIKEFLLQEIENSKKKKIFTYNYFFRFG